MSTIVVELKSQFREIFGQSEIRLQFDGPEVSVEDIMQKIFAENRGHATPGGVRGVKASSAMYVSKNRILRAKSLLGDGDTLTVFPLLFGG